jgi:hypothetical protein
MPITQSDWAALTPGGSRPTTLVSAATIAPTTFLTILTGNTAVATITPPVPFGHMLAIQFAGTAGVVATGNVTIAVASGVGQIMLLVYNPDLAKYVPCG